MKIGQLVKKCQVPKKTLNQVLYRLKKENRVSSPGPGTWRIGGAASRDGAPAIPEDSSAQPSLGNLSCRQSRSSPKTPLPHICTLRAMSLGFKSELGHPFSVS